MSTQSTVVVDGGGGVSFTVSEQSTITSMRMQECNEDRLGTEIK